MMMDYTEKNPVSSKEKKKIQKNKKVWRDRHLGAMLGTTPLTRLLPDISDEK